MKETIENFGGQKHLYGTLCTPETVAFKSGTPCIIMLNSGLAYQAGPHRLYAEMARKMAKLGFCSFRFDLSGIGDSDRSRDSITYDEQIPVDISDALALIEEKTGITSFVLMGICTGADNTHKYALKNNKVIGAIFMDGYAYKTPGYYLRDYGPRIMNPIRVAKWVGRRIFAKPKVTESSSEVNQIQEKEKDGYFWDVPSKDKTIKELKQLVERNVMQLYIFTFDWAWCFNHRAQFDSMYKEIDFKGLASCVYYGQSDHTYTMIDDRLKVIDRVTNWLDSNFRPSS
ncbi:MAG: alpha/beta fold hydrolase [Gammaproteobacteria bacterium]|nr:alpha/beta fold hydrolase [Gammaproteobacteria bacterium]